MAHDTNRVPGRVVIGGLFVWHGIDKFDVGISMIEEMFRSWGVPAPGLAAPLTAIIDIVAGAALILGVMTRAAAMRVRRPAGREAARPAGAAARRGAGA